MMGEEKLRALCLCITFVVKNMIKRMAMNVLFIIRIQARFASNTCKEARMGISDGSQLLYVSSINPCQLVFLKFPGAGQLFKQHILPVVGRVGSQAWMVESLGWNPDVAQVPREPGHTELSQQDF